MTAPGMLRIGHEEPVGNRKQPAKVQEQQPARRGCDLPIELGFSRRVALAGYIELAKLGIHQRQQGRSKDIWRQNGFVDLIPEGVPVPSLNPAS